jgi:1-phosphofructokinase family hexose kinase
MNISEDSSIILTAGLTPAWQQILVLDALRIGQVNRAREVHWCASGKVLNAALACHTLGAPCHNLTMVGGPQGDAMEAEFTALGVSHDWVRLRAPSRVCTTVIDGTSGVSTELVQNALPVREEELRQFVRLYENALPRARAVILIGSLPEGTPQAFYRDLLEKTRVRSVVDASGPELLAALAQKPYCVKPNREELGKSLGCSVSADEDLRAAMRYLNTLGAEWVVVSQGEKPVWASHSGGFLRFRPPDIIAVNPIGSGDCLAAGIACGVAEGMDMPEAIRLGVAAAAENASMLLPARLTRTRVRSLVSRIPIERL